MFEHRPTQAVLRGVTVAVCLAWLAGCGGGGAPTSSTASSAASSDASSAPGTNIAVPATPAGLAATAGNAQVSLTWSASSGATSYNVKRATTSGGPYTQLAAPTSPSDTDTTVTNGTAYFYVVSAVNSAGESANSAEVSATPEGTVTPPPAVAVPAAPVGVAATAGNAQVSLTWSASSGATSYNVKRATTSGGPYTQIGAPTAAAYTNTSLSNGTTYYYVVSAVDSAGQSANSAQVSALPAAPPPTSTSTSTPTSTACGMQLGGSEVFCETFDAPAGVAGTRTGDLNPNVWGVSRGIGAGVNFGQQQYGMWNATTIQKCDGTTPTVNAPANIIICNGQLREATNDNNSGVFETGDVTVQAMYPKQPFDFAGRTGTVSFDVSNDSTGTHSVWPEFWMSDLPVPMPFSHFASWVALPANGFGVRMGNVAPPGDAGECQNSNNLTQYRWNVDSAIVIRNYALEDTNGYGTPTGLTVTQLDCVISSTGPGNMNHVELRISAGEIDVYATDAGVAASPTTLREITKITGANLSFTRGLIWLEDVHYNADKETYLLGTSPSTSQKQHTFSWDNVAFDGPFTDRDFAYDAPDNTLPAVNGAVNLGQFSQANQTSSWNVPNIPTNLTLPAAARVLFSFNNGDGPNPTVLNVIVNGHAHSVPWPYPDQLQGSWRTFAVTIALTDLVPGTNVVQLGTDQPVVFANVDIVLGSVTGGVPVLPGANDTYP